MLPGDKLASEKELPETFRPKTTKAKITAMRDSPAIKPDASKIPVFSALVFCSSVILFSRIAIDEPLNQAADKNSSGGEER